MWTSIENNNLFCHDAALPDLEKNGSCYVIDVLSIQKNLFSWLLSIVVLRASIWNGYQWCDVASCWSGDPVQMKGRKLSFVSPVTRWAFYFNGNRLWISWFIEFRLLCCGIVLFHAFSVFDYQTKFFCRLKPTEIAVKVFDASKRETFGRFSGKPRRCHGSTSNGDESFHLISLE